MFWTQAFRAQNLLDTIWRQVFKEFILALSLQYAVEKFCTQLLNALILSFQKFNEMFYTQLFKEFSLELSFQKFIARIQIFKWLRRHISYDFKIMKKALFGTTSL